ncbi:MAG: hypothetical protein HQL46_16465 [Gammaproteobacteria bacterium]|nr:hypothetical protein [Gammaproteobacteria bacterium]
MKFYLTIFLLFCTLSFSGCGSDKNEGISLDGESSSVNNNNNSIDDNSNTDISSGSEINSTEYDLWAYYLNHGNQAVYYDKYIDNNGLFGELIEKNYKYYQYSTSGTGITRELYRYNSGKYILTQTDNFSSNLEFVYHNDIKFPRYVSIGDEINEGAGCYLTTHHDTYSIANYEYVDVLQFNCSESGQVILFIKNLGKITEISNLSFMNTINTDYYKGLPKYPNTMHVH